MIIMLESIAIQVAAVCILWIFLRWICKNHPKWRNAAGFIVALGSSYSAGFVFDMLTQVGIGRLQFANVILPVFTWTGIAIVCYILALNVALSIRILYIPYLINAGIALLTTIVNWYNIFVALPLLLIALIISRFETQSRLRRSVIFELAGYRLDQDIRDIKAEMEDISHVLDFGPFKRMFSDERIFKTNEVDFLGEIWECMLGVTNNKIYKIALSKKYTSNIFEKINRYFFELYGKPTESQSNEEVIYHIWDTALYQGRSLGPPLSSNLVVSQHYPFNVINIYATSGTPFKKKNPKLLVPK
ncbi:MAG: hypothetical protein WCD80_06215 [Desulfobaccales bacterium]